MVPPHHFSARNLPKDGQRPTHPRGIAVILRLSSSTGAETLLTKCWLMPASVMEQLVSVLQHLPHSHNRLGSSCIIPAPGWQDLTGELGSAGAARLTTGPLREPPAALHWALTPRTQQSCSLSEPPSWLLSSMYCGFQSVLWLNKPIFLC